MPELAGAQPKLVIFLPSNWQRASGTTALRSAEVSQSGGASALEGNPPKNFGRISLEAQPKLVILH
ncbi:hypothetical protein E4U38_005243, partial [Claviceps purpurea]